MMENRLKEAIKTHRENFLRWRQLNPDDYKNVVNSFYLAANEDEIVEALLKFLELYVN